MIDYKNDSSYTATTEPQLLDVPKMLYIMVDGDGAPEATEKYNHEFQQAVEVISAIANEIKAHAHATGALISSKETSTSHIEGLWWTENDEVFKPSNHEGWKWTVMIRVPEFVTPELFKTVINALVKRTKSDTYKLARLETVHEGLSLQSLHTGPYSEQAPSIDRLHEYAQNNGYALSGKYHEIYFGELDDTEPEELNTLLRHPVKKVA